MHELQVRAVPRVETHGSCTGSTEIHRFSMEFRSKFPPTALTKDRRERANKSIFRSIGAKYCTVRKVTKSPTSNRAFKDIIILIIMKVFLHYEENENSDYHKTLKITLPKSWKSGPASNLLSQFVESYNAKFQETNPLAVEDMHLSLRKPVAERSEKTELVALCSDDVVIDEIPDRGDVYICHGASKTTAEKVAEEKAVQQEKQDLLKHTVSCTRFGCNNRFKKDGPIPDCKYHRLPPGKPCWFGCSIYCQSDPLSQFHSSFLEQQSFTKPQSIGLAVLRKRHMIGMISNEFQAV